MNQIKPNSKELLVLNLFYNRFYDLYEEISDDAFLLNEPKVRFYKIREIFSVYKELLGYEPIKKYLEWMKMGGKPPLDGLIGEDLFSFIRNTLLHFPIFDSWDEVYINKDLATWNKSGSIDKFLLKCTKIKIDGKGIIKYRIWERTKQKMTYIHINLPEEYNITTNIFLKNIVSEKEGIKFCIALMKEILDYQVENGEEKDIHIMSQVYIPKR